MINAAINLVSLFCCDHRALADWYASVFGFGEIQEVGSPVFVALAAGPVALGFHHADAYDLLGIEVARRVRGTTVHCTFDIGSPQDVDAALSTLNAHDATILKAPFTTYYGARQIVFADPEDNVMRLSSRQDALNMAIAQPARSSDRTEAWTKR